MLKKAARYATRSLSSPKPVEPAAPRHVVPEPPADGSVSVHRIDFAGLGLKEYKDSVGLVIDNAFTEQECIDLLASTAGASIGSDKNWEVAQINGGPGSKGVTISDYRNGQRIIKDDTEKVDWIFQRLRPHLKDIEEMDQTMTRSWFGGSVPKGSRAKMIRINERLRFLRYTVGGFFRRHQDGQYWTPDGTQRSVYTLQLYLNGSPDTLEGGATRLFSMKEQWEDDEADPKHTIIDVPPRPGRCLIFEQRCILHTGEPVTKGIKVTVRTEFMYGVEGQGKEATDEMEED